MPESTAQEHGADGFVVQVHLHTELVKAGEIGSFQL